MKQFLSQPTVSPASSADMAPISSGSSTWTSSGIPFSFVSMATGIGPSSSGSQATVASVVTSTLLAGLGFSGGVISSFPSTVWPSRAPTHNPTRQAGEPAEPTEDAAAAASAVTTAKDNGQAGAEDGQNSKGQEEDKESEGEDKDEEEEEEEEKDKKKARKGSGGVGEARRKDNNTAVTESPGETSDSTAKETEPDPTDRPPAVEHRSEVSTHSPPDFNRTATAAARELAAFPAPEDPTAALSPGTGKDKKHWPFSIHTGESTPARILVMRMFSSIKCSPSDFTRGLFLCK